MKDFAGFLRKRLGRHRVEIEVNEELSFHLEMLKHDCVQKGMSAETADSAVRQRFGDIERTRRQCLEINRRKDFSTRALKSALVLMFTIGLMLRLFAAAPQYGRLADLSIAIAILGHLFLYLRSLLPARIVMRDERIS
jgi:putative ABC transport system permease protein